MNNKMDEYKKWGITEGIVLCAVLFVAGLLLEYLAGPVNAAFWAFPLNLIAGLFFAYAILMVHWFGRNRRWGRWLSGMPMSLAVILWALYLALLAGIIPQSDTTPASGGENLLIRLGFTHIVSSWFFLLNMGLLLFVLGLVALRRLNPFSWRGLAFFCNHAGLWIALAAGILGSADRKEFHLTLSYNKPMNTAIEKKTGDQAPLPFSIELKKFILEEYPPKLALVDEDGNYLPKGKPAFFTAEAAGAAGALEDWNISVTEYLEEGVSGRTSEFRKAETRGGATAVHVIAANRNGSSYEGWISAGNFMVPPVVLILEKERRYIVMVDREPKRFASELLIHEPGKEPVETTIDVNHPASVGKYHLYQSSYNYEQGRWSAHSGLMITTDPAMYLVYTGIFLMLGGALLLFIIGPEKKRL